MTATRRKNVRTTTGAEKAVLAALASGPLTPSALAAFVALYGPKSQPLIVSAVSALHNAGKVAYDSLGALYAVPQQKAGGSKGKAGSGSYRDRQRQQRAEEEARRQQERTEHERARQTRTGNRFRGLSPAAAKTLFRTETMRLHPDRNGGDATEYLAMCREYEAR